MSPRRTDSHVRHARMAGSAPLTPLVACALVALAGCKIQETGFSGSAADPGAPPIAPATAAPIAADAGAPIATPPLPPATPAPDAGTHVDAKSPATTPPMTSTTMPPGSPVTMPPPPTTADAGLPTASVDATPTPPPSPPVDASDAGTVPPPSSGPKTDVCAPSAKLTLTARVQARVKGAEDFTFDNDGNLLLFQNRDVLRLEGDAQPFVILRNVIGLGTGALHALPDGDLLIAETGRDHVLRVDPAGRKPETMAMQLRSPMKIAPALAPGSVYVTSQSDAIYLLDTVTNQMKTIDQLDYRPAGIAIDPAKKKLYVGATTRSVVYVYDIGPAGELSNRTIAVNQISQPTALLVDDCGGLYIGGTDGGNLRRLAPGGALSVIARFEGPDINTLAFGSGKHGWSDRSLFALDTWVGTLYEVELR
jgi:hypothetical protein